jgi:hypothetical protein
MSSYFKSARAAVSSLPSAVSPPRSALCFMLSALKRDALKPQPRFLLQSAHQIHILNGLP